MKKQKTEGTFLAIRDKILQRGMGTAYIKKKCFSPLSNPKLPIFFTGNFCAQKDMLGINININVKIKILNLIFIPYG